MLAKTPLSTVPPSGGTSANTGLRPTQTGGKLFIPGYHRTEEESDAASIILEKIRPGRATAVYGPGFYMTRTFRRQLVPRMLRSYGDHIVRCRVDISKFICFDHAVAKRVWGEKHSLIHQLKDLTAVFKDNKLFIKNMSRALDMFWNDRKNAKQHYTWSSEIAKAVAKRLELWRYAPGIIYTGKQDGACVLAYNPERVIALETARVPKPTTVSNVVWTPAHDPKIRRKHAPDVALLDDIQTYMHALTCDSRKTTDRIARMEQCAHDLPNDPHDRYAFCLALHKVYKAPVFKPTKARIFELFSPDIITFLSLDLPHRGGDRGFIDVSEKLGASERTLAKYLKHMPPRHTLWLYLRKAVFAKIGRDHEAFIEKICRTLIEDLQDTTNPPGTHIVATIRDIFHFNIDRQGSIRPRPQLYGRTGSTVEMDGVEFLMHVVEGWRVGATGRRRMMPVEYYQSPLYAEDSYRKLLRRHWLLFYKIIRSHKCLREDPHIKKYLAAWWMDYGKRYKQEWLADRQAQV